MRRIEINGRMRRDVCIIDAIGSYDLGERLPHRSPGHRRRGIEHRKPARPTRALETDALDAPARVRAVDSARGQERDGVGAALSADVE